MPADVMLLPVRRRFASGIVSHLVLSKVHVEGLGDCFRVECRIEYCPSPSALCFDILQPMGLPMQLKWTSNLASVSEDAVSLKEVCLLTFFLFSILRIKEQTLVFMSSHIQC
jgi:hypothetical protein